MSVKLTMPSRHGKPKTYEFGMIKKDDGLVYYVHIPLEFISYRYEMFENIWKFNLNNKETGCKWACENPIKFEFVITEKGLVSTSLGLENIDTLF